MGTLGDKKGHLGTEHVVELLNHISRAADDLINSTTEILKKELEKMGKELHDNIIKDIEERPEIYYEEVNHD